MDLEAFHAVAATWQNFYLLVGGAAATLTGLMFVAVTFGASLVKPETADTARSFLDPTFGHFAQVLFTACLMLIPTIRPIVLGSILLVQMAVRIATLWRVYRHMRKAQAANADLDVHIANVALQKRRNAAHLASERCLARRELQRFVVNFGSGLAPPGRKISIPISNLLP